MLNWIHGSYSKRICNRRTSCRAACRADPHAHSPRRLHVVVDDKEVTGEPHRLDDVQLEVDPLYDFRRRRFAPTLLHTLVCERGEVVRLVTDPLRYRKFNDLRCFAYLVIFDSLCKLDRVLDPFWMLLEPNGHLFSRQQAFSPVAMSAPGISQFSVVEDGAIDVKRLGIIFFDEPHRICRADRDRRPSRTIEVIIFRHESEIVAKHTQALIHEVRLRITRHADKTFAPFLDVGECYESVFGTLWLYFRRRDANKVAVADLVLCIKAYDIMLFIHRRRDGSSDYRLDGREITTELCLPRMTRRMELGRSEHKVSVGERNRWEPHLPRLSDEAWDLADGISHRIRRADI